MVFKLKGREEEERVKQVVGRCQQIGRSRRRKLLCAWQDESVRWILDSLFYVVQSSASFSLVYFYFIFLRASIVNCQLAWLMLPRTPSISSYYYHIIIIVTSLNFIFTLANIIIQKQYFLALCSNVLCWFDSLMKNYRSILYWTKNKFTTFKLKPTGKFTVDFFTVRSFSNFQFCKNLSAL